MIFIKEGGKMYFSQFINILDDMTWIEIQDVKSSTNEIRLCDLPFGEFRRLHDRKVKRTFPYVTEDGKCVLKIILKGESND